MKPITILLLPLMCILFSCTKDPKNSKDDPKTTSEYGFGLSDNQSYDKIPLNVNFGFGSGKLPASYSLVDKLPPMNDQGQYGTCVAWALGYNLKSLLTAVERDLKASDMQNPENQFSPKYLFTAIPDNEKGPNCNSTNFESAFKIMQSNGVAKHSSVPYENLGGCYQSSILPSWNDEAKNYKIEYYRLLKPNIEEIKTNIANNIPVAIGIDVTDNFLNWRSSGVLSSKSTSNIKTIHSKHAVLIVGYDDNKGPNGAVRIANSWGADWGDNGFVWVDYNFLLEGLIFSGTNGNRPIFVAKNLDGNNEAPDKKDNTQKTGVDLASWVYSDNSLYEQGGAINERLIHYDIFNIGNQNLSSSSKIGFHYYLINPYNVSEYILVFKDEITNEIDANTYYCPNANECYINVDINASGSLATSAGWTSVQHQYFLPKVTGEYYVVLVADPDGKVKEKDVQNNLFFSAPYPVYINNGLINLTSDDESSKFIAKSSNDFKSIDEIKQTASSTFQSIQHQIRQFDRNAYTPQEVIQYLAKEIEANNHLNHFVPTNQSGGIQDLTR